MKQTINDNVLGRNRMNEIPKINQLQVEVNTWKRLLNFFSDENVCLKNRLSEILKNGFDRKLLEEFENFQTKFIKQDETITFLRNDIAELDKLLLNEKLGMSVNENAINRKLEHLRKNIVNSEGRFFQLQINFNTYVLENM
jgi:hypothetical protein